MKKYLAMLDELVEFVESLISGTRHISNKTKTDMDLDWNEIVAGRTVVIDSIGDVVGTFSARNAQHFTLSSTGSTLSIEKGSTADSAIYSDNSTTIRFSTVDEDGGSYTIVGSESNSFTWKE